MIRRNDRGDYVAILLEQESWIEHGFGTRQSPWLDAGIATLQQVHSDRVVTFDRVQSGLLGEGDALVANLPGVRLVVRTADCVPVLLADPRKRAVAAVHAGWRGTASQVVSKTVMRMEAEFGTEPHDVIAVVGPSIGGCCYEVGNEVVERLRQWDPRLGQVGGAECVDLPDINRAQLRETGVREENIFVSGLCTRCRGDEFHSFRRDREQAGRMQSWIGIR